MIDSIKSCGKIYEAGSDNGVGCFQSREPVVDYMHEGVGG